MTNAGIGSAESIHGWSQLYLGLPLWAERIREAVRGSNRDRDELEFYLCFFVQCHSLRDWMIHNNAASKSVIQDAVAGDEAMKICRDICNRFKHLNIGNPSVDARWSIRRSFLPPDNYELVVVANGDVHALWSLMMRCLEFWKVLVAAYDLETSEEWYLR